MSVSALLRRRVTFPMYNILSRETSLRRIAMLRRTQWWTPGHIEAYQTKRLRALVEHAYRTSPYWRETMDRCSLSPGSIHRVQDIAHLPVLTKADLQANRERMVSSAFDRAKLRLNASGGSTGEPTSLYQDMRRNWLRNADVYRHDAWAGWRIGEPVYRAWGAAADIATPSLSQRRRDAMLGPSYFLNAFEVSDDLAGEFLLQMLRERRFLLVGYAGALCQLARVAMERDIHPHPVGIVASAETLTPQGRAALVEAFGCQVYDRYGSREVGLIASECEQHRGLHIAAEHVLVEVDGVGQYGSNAGRVLVTDLENYGMPLMRYELGDVAELAGEPCPCGRGLALLRSVQGRMTDFIVCAGGRRIHGEYFTHLFYNVDGIRRFRLVQGKDRNICIELVNDGRCEAAKISSLSAQVRQAVGDGIDVTWREVSEIRTPPSGKFRFTVSHCV